jgi:hypothetical protein
VFPDSASKDIQLKAVYTERHRAHDPQFFLVRGVVRRTTEQPERADRLLKGLAAGSTISLNQPRLVRGRARESIVPSICAFLRRPGRNGRHSAMPVRR